MTPVQCACCLASYPPDEGQLGDTCPLCGWECDTIEGEAEWSSANKECLPIFRTAWFHSVTVEAQRAYVIRACVTKRAAVWQKLDAGIPVSTQ